MLKFKYCYHKRMKNFFGYSKYHSVTEMLFGLGLPSLHCALAKLRHSVF